MSKQVEEWRPVVGYEGLYEVSDWGRVRSLDRVVYQKHYSGCMSRMVYKGKFLKPQINKDGYQFILLYKNGNGKPITVHKLVAETFLPIPEELQHLIGTRKLQVGHLKTLPDGTEDNTANETWNIRWMSAKENTNFGTANERRKDKQTNNQKISKQVYQYDLDDKLINIWSSTRECGRNGYGQTSISACCRGERKTHKGYKWSYEPL